MKKIILAAVAYGLIAVGTYGHSAAKGSAWVEAHCSNVVLAKKTGRSCTEYQPVIAAFFGAVLWPLYWSWELQS